MKVLATILVLFLSILCFADDLVSPNTRAQYLQVKKVVAGKRSTLLVSSKTKREIAHLKKLGYMLQPFECRQVGVQHSPYGFWFSVNQKDLSRAAILNLYLTKSGKMRLELQTRLAG